MRAEQGASRMTDDLAVLAERGVEACVAGDRARAAGLVRALIERVDLDDAAAPEVCRLYEEALADLAAGRFGAARALFHALRTV
jgi:hypothetical protein